MLILRKVNLWPRLVLGVSLGFLILFAVLSALILRVVDDSRDRIFQERLTIARMAAGQVDSLLRHGLYDLESVSTSTRFTSTDPDDTAKMLTRTFHGIGDMWAGLYVFDSEGQLLAAAPSDRAQTSAMARAVASDRPSPIVNGGAASDPYVDEATGRPSATLTVSMGPSDETELILVGVMDLSHADLLVALEEATTLGETGHAELVDRRGLVIASTERVGFLAPGEHREFYVRMVNQSTEGVETVPYEPRTAEETEEEGEGDHIMAFAQVARGPWGVAVGASEAETLAPVIDLRNNMLILGAASLVVLWIVTIVGTRVLVRPVRGLTKAADGIASGDLKTPIRVAEGGEIGRLGETLEVMRCRLKASLDEIAGWSRELETKVAQRTEALNARNRQLTALTAVATAANESRNPNQMLERCLGIMLEHIGMEAGAILVLDREKGGLVAAARLGAFDQFPCGERVILPRECPCGHVAATAKPIVGDAMRPGALSSSGCAAANFSTFAILPLQSPKGVEGVLYLGTRNGRRPDADQMEVLTVMSNQVGVAIENAQLLQDLTKTEAQRELHRLKSQFMSSLSHELRTPLEFIRGYVSTLLRDDLTTDPDTQREFLQVVDDESGKLEALIDDLLDASKLHSGGLRLKRTRSRLSAIAEQVVTKLGAKFPQEVLSLDQPAEEPEVLADTWRIEQVIQNLVDNAIKYSPPGSPVSLSIEFVGTEIALSVRDEGDGLADDEIRRIFEPFYRGSEAQRLVRHGTGLGLTISRGIVEAHSGRIWVERNADRGSTFYMSLPIASQDSSQNGGDSAGRDGEQEGAKAGSPPSFAIATNLDCANEQRSPASTRPGADR